MFVLYIILYSIGTLLLYFAWARLWVMHIASKKVQGSDLHMLKWCLQKRSRAWAGFHITLHKDAPYSELKQEMINNIDQDMKSADSSYRRGMDLNKQCFVFYGEYEVSDILLHTEQDTDFFQLSDEKNKELVYKFHDKRELIGALFDHTVWDGIRMFNETLAPAIKSKPFESRWLLGDRYFPIFSELLMIYTLIIMTARWLMHKPLPLLEQESQQKLLRHRLSKREVTKLKNRTQSKFTAALLATWAHRLFESLDEDRTILRFGLVIGMNNPRFRNNYSLMIIDIHRQDLEEQVSAIQNQMRKRAIEVMPIYHLLSLVEMQSTLKKTMVDCLFSPGIFEPDDGPSKFAKDLFLYIVPTSMPIYSFACSLGDEITISTTWNSSAISIEQLSSDADALYEQGPVQRLKVVFESGDQFKDLHRDTNKYFKS